MEEPGDEETAASLHGRHPLLQRTHRSRPETHQVRRHRLVEQTDHQSDSSRRPRRSLTDTLLGALKICDSSGIEKPKKNNF